jgi:methyl-accepting chemotaxis protein
MNRFRLADLPLIIKLAFAPALALVMLAVLAVGMIASQSQQTAALQRVVQTDMSTSLRLEQISKRISAANGELYMIMTHQAGKIDVDQNTAKLGELSKTLDDISKDVATAAASAPPGDKAEFTALQHDLKDYKDGVDVVGSMLGIDFGTAVTFVQPFERQYGAMTDTLDKLVNRVRSESQARADAAAAAATAAKMVAIIATALTLVVVGALAGIGVLGVRRAVADIAGATNRLARGDSSLDLEGLARRDELGEIVSALRVFRDAALEKDRLQVESEQARRTANDERSRHEAEQVRMAAQQAQVVETLDAALGQLSQGDLTVTIDQVFAPEYEQLRGNFNAAIDQLRQAIGAVVSNASSIQASTGAIRSASDDLSRRTEQQAATLEQTAAAVEQITETVKHTASAAGHARQTVHATRDRVEDSGGLMRQAVSAMGEIERSAGEIGLIIGVIDEIAFQTNLLALNAGVEAARAGDSGRGFAVVAQEVRALAQRSADAAKEIKTLISNSNRQVGQGVDLVEKTGKALDAIVVQVAEVTKLVGDIAASATEQATALDEVNRAVTQMDQVTQQNAAMVEESAAASHSLATDADELQQLVARFSVGRVEQAASRARPQAPAARAPSRAQAAPAYRPRAVAPARTQTATAAKVDTWEEF